MSASGKRDKRVANGAYIASVASSDDELELSALNGLYVRTQSGPNVTRYARTGHYFYVLADGNAVNFLHGASVGSFILLVQAEILAAHTVLACYLAAHPDRGPDVFPPPAPPP